MSALGNPRCERAAATPRRSASHGEAGYARRPRDAYFTEPWVTRALLAVVSFRVPRSDGGFTEEVWEPAVGDGRIAAELVRAGYQVRASDIHDYGWPGTALEDFIRTPLKRMIPAPAIVTNPPFTHPVGFVLRALELTRDLGGMVAMLQRHDFDACATNRPLFLAPNPFLRKLVLPRRPWWTDTRDPKHSPRFPYAWYLWDWRAAGPLATLWLDDPDHPPQPGLPRDRADG